MTVKRGFTLIEVCIVLAVVLLVAALLFPVLGRAREEGHQATCQSNLRQMHLGFVQYVQDNDGHFIPAIAGYPFRGSISGTDYILALQPYVKNNAIFRCPTSQVDEQDRDTDYQYNYGKLIEHVYLPDGRGFITSRHESRAQSPSTTPVFWDIGPSWNSSNSDGNGRPMLHSGGGNYCLKRQDLIGLFDCITLSG